MKIVNKPIKVMAIFNPNGDIVPVKFRLDDLVVPIEKIDKVYEEKIVGNKRIIFLCVHAGRDLYEIKFEKDTNIWYLFKQ